MKLTLIRCGICLDWHMPGKHCSTCGAYHLRGKHGQVIHLNKQGVEMVRGIPIPLDQVIARAIKRMS